jgi:hypothetical protein
MMDAIGPHERLEAAAIELAGRRSQRIRAFRSQGGDDGRKSIRKMIGCLAEHRTAQ